MHFAFSEDQTLLRDTVRDVLSKECTPEVVRRVWTGDNAERAPVWGTLAENGFVGMAASEDAGGMGMSEVDLALVLEEAGYAGLTGPIVETALAGLPLLETLGAGGPHARWIERVAGGEASLALCFEGQQLALHAPLADLLLIARGDALYAVPRAAAGLAPQVAVDRATSVATLAYEPQAAHLVAQGPAAQAAIQLAYERAALGNACVLVGLARRMLDMAVAYAKDREQFGKPIGTQQAVQHHLANAAGRIAFAQPVVYRAAWALANRDRGGDETRVEAELAVSTAKVYAEEAGRVAARIALQVHGAIGYTIECDLHFFMKRVWTIAPFYGTSAAHRARIGAHIL
ncbi:MAG: acyl-CoA dehydrogenase family protein [Polyangiales bacterium]